MINRHKKARLFMNSNYLEVLALKYLFKSPYDSTSSKLLKKSTETKETHGLEDQ